MAVVISNKEKDVFFLDGKAEESGKPALDGSAGLKLTPEACFDKFDLDKDSNLNLAEFSDLLKALFRDEKGQPYNIDEKRAKVNKLTSEMNAQDNFFNRHSLIHVALFLGNV